MGGYGVWYLAFGVRPSTGVTPSASSQHSYSRELENETIYQASLFPHSNEPSFDT
jgi:hypothetical protein